MTSSHRIEFLPADISNVSFRCNNCGCGINVAGATDIRDGRVLLGCPVCGRKWLKNEAEASLYLNFMKSFRDLVEAQDTEEDFTVLFSLPGSDEASRPDD